MCKIENAVKYLVFTVLISATSVLHAQVNWKNADADYGSLPNGFHVFKTTDSLDGKPFTAYYAIGNLKNKKLLFTTDTTFKRRLTPADFYKKSGQPLLVVNTTFFSFASNKSLNIVVKNGKLLAFNNHTIPLKGQDTFTYKHPFASAIGISKKRRADVAWTYTDTSLNNFYALQNAQTAIKDSNAFFAFKKAELHSAGKINANIMGVKNYTPLLRKWKVQTAVGGGPVLVQNGQVKIANNEELKFSGKAINDLHPRTLMGYTADDKIIIMVIEGRNPGKADGASLTQAAQLMQRLGCVEALNLDGGGSSCMLINGKETIRPSDKGEQRPVPAVFMISSTGK